MTDKGQSAPFVLGLGGTLRHGSLTERLLRFCLAEAEALGARTAILAGDDLRLPLYEPGLAIRQGHAVARMMDLFRKADGIIVATPSYHGAVSGVVKNLLDYTEELRSDERVYWDGCAVGCITVAAGWQAGVNTLGSLRSIAHALRGWPTPFGAVINSSQTVLLADGTTVDSNCADRLRIVAAQVVDFGRKRQDLRVSVMSADP